MKYVLALLTTVLIGAATLGPTQLAVASPASQAQEGVNSISEKDKDGNVVEQKTLMEYVLDLINVLLFIIGAVSVIMIIFGGFKYVTSSGESSAVSSAKNTILYAVVGLVIALSAYGIANFVTEAVNPPKTWADCNRYNDRAKKAQCQRDMRDQGASDVPPGASGPTQ